MNVLVVPSWYPEGEDKLMGIYHKEFCKALSLNGVNANMIYIYRQGLKSFFKYLFMNKKSIDNEDTYKVYKYKMLDIEKISVKLFMHNYVNKLDKAFKEYVNVYGKPDIIHAMVTIPAGYAASKIGKKYGIPVILTEHGSCFYKFYQDKYRPYGFYALNNSTFTTVSKFMHEHDFLKGRYCGVIPNTVDVDRFNVKRYKRGKTLNLIAICAFRIGKGIEYIISALDILINKYNLKDIHLNLVGDGYLMDFYKEKVSELNLDSFVTFHGKKSKEEIVDLLSCNDIYINGSDFETFCIPGIEALASGIPIVSTKCHGPEEYMDSKCGELSNIKDPQSIAEAIFKVYKNLDNYDINYLRKVASKFSYKNVTKTALSEYKKIIKK